MMFVVLRISEEPIDRLDQHTTIPIAFRVERILSVSAPSSGLGGIRLSEAAVERPWVKDYDAIKGEGPTRWPKRFDTSNWGLIAAYDGPNRVGGAVIAFNTTGVHMLEGRSDTAVLWDLRVGPEYRSSGIGSSLFRAVEVWCSHRACNLLKVETQNINGVDRRAGKLRDSTIEDRIPSFWSRPSRTVGPSAGVPLEVVGV
jgi:GNAT superfamily N-acetyltransferase